jgi:phosphoribosylamine--glycine ligase
VQVFHAGTALDARGQLVSAGGRVLTVCALGDDVERARQRAYAALSTIRMRGGHHRRDIGLK